MLEVKDFRKFNADKAEAEAKVSAPLLEQALSEAASTGDPRFDKLIRTVQKKVDDLEKQSFEMATKGMTAVPADLVKLCQLEYLFLKGKIEAYKDAMLIPSAILTEEKVK